jgi:hypothetical protein
MFLIGVYGPSMTAASFTKWKCFGINTVVDIPDNYPGSDSDVTLFDGLAKQVGLYQIRQPFMGGSAPGTTAEIQKDLGNTSLLAFNHRDEPNNNCGTAVPVSTVKNEYVTWKAAMPNMPVMTNFSGGDISTDPQSWGCTNQATVYPPPSGFLAYTDWVSNDLYPVSFYYETKASKGLTAIDLPMMLNPIEKISGWVPSMPQFAFIEASRILETNIANSVTGAQMTAEIWEVITKGVRGIIYFPDVVASDVGFRFDGSGDSYCANSVCADPTTWTCPCNDADTKNEATCDDKSAAGDPQGVSAAMIAQDGILNALGPVLQGAVNPAGASVTVASPLLAGWRIDAAGARWFIVVNPSASAVSSATLTLTGVTAATASVYNESRTVPISGGAITDAFNAYEVHIYSVVQ